MSLEQIDRSETTTLSRLLPGGFGRSTFAVGERAPLVVRGEGWRLWDERGRELIDLNNNFTALVHGHAHERLVAAADRALRGGASFGLPNEAELLHANALMERLPGLDQIRYANSGTEAVMTALRVARAHTGRDGVLFVRNAYHGTADAALVPGGERSQRGIPAGVRRDVQNVPINDVAALRAAVEAGPERLAALVLDFLPSRAGLIALDDAFVDEARALCRHHGILLVADEVMSFRLGWSGLAAARGVTPDLMTLGKVIGGGHPVGAVAGRAAVMAELDPRRPDGLEHGGTFSANPVTMAAGLASLELLDRAEIARVNALGATARGALGGRIAAHRWEVRGHGSLLRLVAPDGDTPAQRLALWWQAYERGVLLMPTGLAALSTPMDAAVVADVVERLADAVEAVGATEERPMA